MVTTVVSWQLVCFWMIIFVQLLLHNYDKRVEKVIAQSEPDQR